MDGFDNLELRDVAERLLDVAEDSGAVIAYRHSYGPSIPGRCPAWVFPISVAWLYSRTGTRWMRTRDSSFGASDFEPDSPHQATHLLLVLPFGPSCVTILPCNTTVLAADSNVRPANTYDRLLRPLVGAHFQARRSHTGAYRDSVARNASATSPVTRDNGPELRALHGGYRTNHEHVQSRLVSQCRQETKFGGNSPVTARAGPSCRTQRPSGVAVAALASRMPERRRGTTSAETLRAMTHTGYRVMSDGEDRLWALPRGSPANGRHRTRPERRKRRFTSGRKNWN